MKRIPYIILTCSIAAAMVTSGCGDMQNIKAIESTQGATDLSGTQPVETKTEPITSSARSGNDSVKEESAVNKIKLNIGNSSFTATLESNGAANALVDMLKKAPLVIEMSDYSGFEKVGSLKTSLPADNKQTTTQSGDIVLYNGNQIVIFYGSNSWSYTRLGKIDDLSGWEEALGSGDVTVTFSLE